MPHHLLADGYQFLLSIGDQNRFNINLEDEVVRRSIVTHKGDMMWPAPAAPVSAIPAAPAMSAPVSLPTSNGQDLAEVVAIEERRGCQSSTDALARLGPLGLAHDSRHGLCAGPREAHRTGLYEPLHGIGSGWNSRIQSSLECFSGSPLALDV